jgi:hypothetical protein
MHGGSSPQARRKGQRRKEVQAVVADAKATLAYEGVRSSEHPIEELSRLVSEAGAFKDALAKRVNALNSLSFVAAGAGTEQLRSEVALYERAMDRAARFLEMTLRLNLDERIVKLSERQGEQLFGAIQQILDALQLTSEQRSLVPQVVPPILRSIGEAEVVR